MFQMITTLVQSVVTGGSQNAGGKSPVGNPSENMLAMLQSLTQQLGISFLPGAPGQGGGAPFSPLQNPGFGSAAFASSSTSPGSGKPATKDAPKPGGIGGGPLGGIVNGFTSVAKNLLSGGKVPIGASVMVGVLQSIVGTSCTDPQQRANIQKCLQDVQSGKPLQQCLSQLCDQDKTKLADTIGSCGFEIPECLNEYASNPDSSGNSARPDCALKTVEESESGRYGGTLAGILTAPLELLRGGGLGI